MKRLVFCAWALLVIAYSAALAGGDANVDSANYASWSKVKPGTTVVLVETTYLIGKSLEAFRHHTLEEVKNDRAIVESRHFGTAGAETKEYRTTYPVWKTITVKKNAKEAALAPNADSVFEANEKVKIGPKTYACSKFVRLANVFGNETRTYTWVAPEVPGLVVKKVVEEKFAGKWQKKEMHELKEIKTP